MPDEDDHPGTEPALPREVQEHLGRQLRATLRTPEAAPAFLGDTALPPQFERHIRRLRIHERGVQRGYDAVRDALGLPDGPDAADPDAAPPRTR